VTGGNEGVFCGNCGRELDVPSDVPPERRDPCPVCGSTVRDFRDSATVVLRITGISASAVANEPTIRVESVQADRRPEAETIRGRFRATLDWQELGNGLWMLHVLNERGDLVEGGVGDSPEDALLEVYERLIPPT
jgi:hypothetical protein